MIPAKTLDDLGWARLLAHLSERAHTRRGAAACLELELCASADEAGERLSRVTEVRALTAIDAALPFGGITDVRTAIDRADKGGVLDPEELVAVARAGQGACELGQHLRRHVEEAPRMALVAEAIEDLGHVYHPILESFEPDGRLADHASDRLGDLRRQAARLKVQLEKRAAALVDEPRIQKHLQDSYYTQREDRYVVPVKVESRSAVKGIVHGTSHSGQTLFIEPDEIVDLNNALKLAECEVADEERRILAELTGYVAEDADSFRRALEVVTAIDVIDAAGRLADDLEAEAPVIDPTGAFELLRARHPLMVASGKHCVPNDIALRPRSILVISGPNAGGKTVALKTAGLAVLMTRAGLHIPAASGSRVPWLDNVLCDIGDSQSIEMDLSTFTGHLQSLELFLREADDRTLILIDEIAVGTEPEQGAALARAVLESLAERGTPTIVTTHYEALKAMAAADDRFENASVGFDLEQMEPTFELHLGTPGSSGALRVARRMGLPEGVIDRAEAILGAGRASVEELMASLEEARRELAEERARTAASRDAAERARREAESARAAADERRRKLHEGMYDDALRSLKEARLELDQLKGTVKRRRKQAGGPAVIEDARKADEIASSIARHAPERPAPPGKTATEAELGPGARVFVVPLGGEGVVAEPPAGGKVQVQVGALRTTADVPDLRLLPARGGPKKPAPKPAPKKPRAPAGQGGQEAGSEEKAYARTPDATVDVRGERAHEATSAVDKFIDESLREVRECIFVIHGHGTGALRRAVRELLQEHPSVARFRPGLPGEGGDGITVAWLDVA